MGWLITIIVGAIIGWIANAMMDTENRMGLLWDIVIGIVGSILGAWIFGAIFGVGSAFLAGTFTFWGILWGVIGAIILIAILRGLKIVR